MKPIVLEPRYSQWLPPYGRDDEPNEEGHDTEANGDIVVDRGRRKANPRYHHGKREKDEGDGRKYLTPALMDAAEAELHACTLSSDERDDERQWPEEEEKHHDRKREPPVIVEQSR